MRVRFLSIGRPLDAEGRKQKLRRSLSTAHRVGASHVVVSGDLTEIGTPGEYETLAEVLHDSGFAPETVTLVPGNHDLYSTADAWKWALEGPLAAYARTSAAEPGKVVDLGAAALLPIDATFHQPVTRSAGLLGDDALDVIARRAGDPALAGKPLLLVQHHPPFVRKTSALHWIDGLVGAARLMSVLESFRNLFVLHGHLHHIVDRVIGAGVARIYDAVDGRLEAAGLVRA
jgi:Icc protein